MAWYGLLVLPRSTTMQNFGLLACYLTELWPFEIFGIWNDSVFYGILWYGVLVLPRSTTMPISDS